MGGRPHLTYGNCGALPDSSSGSGVEKTSGFVNQHGYVLRFETTSEIPINRACFSASLSPNALHIISGTVGISRFRTRAASKPFITGHGKV